jgi:hypothetical protein
VDAALCFLPGDIDQMPSSIRLTVFAFRFGVCFSCSWATKNPAYVAVSRVGKFYGFYDRITCLPKAYRGYTQSDLYSDYLIGSG